ncbi:MAG: iron-containing alcohol dehydrogenase [Caldilineaceae bacterium]|nr:iron-containing alcohol dehydrogenase [Caldilineaceae bacterium]
MTTWESAFTMDTSSIKFGPGVTREVGADMVALGCKRVLVVTDPRIARLEPVAIALEALRNEGIDAVLFDRTRVEPTDQSFKETIQFATEGNFDGYVAVGGGSSIDTAKAANLYATYPADFLDYVNPPIGKGKPVPGRLKPLIAIPTTAGTGSETTGVAIFDLVEMHAKTGIAHRGPRQHTHAAQNGGRVQRARRAQPRARIAHRAALQPPPSARIAQDAPGLSGRQPHQPDLGDARHRDDRGQPRARHRRPGRR